jgi:hypothetical protein
MHWMVKGLGLSIDILNATLANYEYLHVERRDKPSKVTETHLEGSQPSMDGKIKQTSGQMMVLARNFIPIFGPLIWAKGLSEHPKWRCCVHLIQLFWCLMSVEVELQDLLDMEQMIGAFYELFLAAWGPDWTLPKHHWMLHGPLDIFLYGPMRYWWCMRFEAKHQW